MSISISRAFFFAVRSVNYSFDNLVNRPRVVFHRLSINRDVLERL